LPQGYDDRPTLAGLKRHDQCSLHGRAGRFSNDRFNRDVLPAISVLASLRHRKRLDDAVASRVEADGGVLRDERAVERSSGGEEAEQRLLFGRRRPARDGEGPTG
jgi:hypothetical protein